MDHLWSHGGQDAKAVHRVVGRPRRITLNTIQSTLKRLFEKQLLTREKVSHAHVYAPRVTRAAFHRHALQDVIEKMMGGEPDAMLSAFVGVTEQLGAKQLEQLEKLVSERLKKRNEAEGRR